ncbi:MAG: cation:proton antiporter regulatory subunit [Candidatus Nanopelagicales bacterium]
MDVSETLLPGVGIRYEFETSSHQRVGVIVYREGNSEIVTYAKDDPDACTTLLELDASEGETIAEILGAPRFTKKLADLTREIPGLHSEPIRLPSTSAYVGKTLGQTHCRTLTGASIVAVVRGEEVITSPPPDQLLLANDVLVAIGTASGVRKVHALLEASNVS